MTPEKYKAERKARGTQQVVADLLDVHRVTVAKREGGQLLITREAWLALLCLTAGRPKPAHAKSGESRWSNC